MNNMRKTKCQFEAEKKRKKQKLEAAAQAQKGALDRFVVKEPQINSRNQPLIANIDIANGDDIIEVDTHAEEFDEGNDNMDDEGDGAKA